jgi:hypothetical protein
MGRIAMSTTALLLVLASSASASFTPKWGRYTGDHSLSVRFRVNRDHGHVSSFHMVTSCGTYDVASVALAHGKFHFRVGPPDRPLQVFGQTTTAARFDLTWNVGYTALNTPSCLLHDQWSASWRSR